MKSRMLPQPVGLLKLMLNLFCTSNTQGREICRCEFIKYTINIVLCLDTCEQICFKLGMMLGATYSLQFDSSLIDHTVHSRSQGNWKL